MVRTQVHQTLYATLMLPEPRGRIAHVVMRIMETLAYQLVCVSTVSPVNRVTCYGQQHVQILHSKIQVVLNTATDVSYLSFQFARTLSNTKLTGHDSQDRQCPPESLQR